ncbi:hypothetical protein AgCh_010507 [Apium graveolens]
MANDESLDALLEELDISNEENEELVFDEEIDEHVNKFELCLVGRFLTEKNINVRAIRSKMADIWRPAAGINIKSLTTGMFLFQFYHKDDMQWVMNNGSWSFGNALLVTRGIPDGEDPTNVPLNKVDFWIQIYDLPSCFMSEAIGKQLGNFFSSFVMYDPNNNTSIWREYMRIKIKVDVRLPLKRKKKICSKNRKECIVNCKYEKLGEFCFVCGMLTHTERFCKKRREGGVEGSSHEWGSWLRAPLWRGAVQGRSKWLRDEGAEGFDSNEIIMATEGATNNILNYTNGPGLHEMDGLDIEERKRKRTGLSVTMDPVDTIKSDSGLSTEDCTKSSSTIWAKLAKQASQGL